MFNPLGLVKDTRTSYNVLKQKNIVEVFVQFKNEDPTWIPKETLLAIRGYENDY
jgi:hypothetical protein